MLLEVQVRVRVLVDDDAMSWVHVLLLFVFEREGTKVLVVVWSACEQPAAAPPPVVPTAKPKEERNAIGSPTCILLPPQREKWKVLETDVNDLFVIVDWKDKNASLLKDTILFLWNEWEDDVMRDVFFQNEMKHRSNHVGLGAQIIRGGV